MTELMKQYEAETGQEMPTVNIYRLLEWYRSYSQWLKSKNTQLKSHISTIEEQLCVTIEEVCALKAQLRWRPVSEKPEKGQYFLANPSQTDRDLIIDACPRTYQFLGECSWEKFVQSRGIVKWLPIPPQGE